MALMNDMWPRLHHTTHTLQKQNTTRHLPVNQTHHSLRNLHWIWMHVLMNNATARLWWYFILIVLKTQLASCAIPQAVNKEHKEHIKGVVYFGAWQGLSNQRQCVINAIIMAERLGYAVLLPQLRLNFLANDANDHLVPFSYLYKVRMMFFIYIMNGTWNHTCPWLDHPLLCSCRWAKFGIWPRNTA